MCIFFFLKKVFFLNLNSLNFIFVGRVPLDPPHPLWISTWLNTVITLFNSTMLNFQEWLINLSEIHLSNFRDEDGHKMDNISLSDDFGKQIESDEDSMGEYGGDLDISKFNEDGSFIGIYADKVTNNSKQSTV